ncbi:unnamed protein product [Leuciscus chuanchicus]
MVPPAPLWSDVILPAPSAPSGSAFVLGPAGFVSFTVCGSRLVMMAAAAVNKMFAVTIQTTERVIDNVEIPETVDDSFYRGQVTVLLKDSVFQPSSAFRHATEMMRLLGDDMDKMKPFLIIYSDGGPDHRVPYEGVKLSLAAVFRALDLDIHVAGRTAPGHSWANPVEQIMSVLNLAFQNIALSRQERSAEVEQVLRSCGGMQDIRKKADMVQKLRDEWSGSVKSIKDLLEERITRVQLKGRPFTVLEPVSDFAIHQEQADIIGKIDASIEIGKYHKKDLANNENYKTFMA